MNVVCNWIWKHKTELFTLTTRTPCCMITGCLLVLLPLPLPRPSGILCTLRIYPSFVVTLKTCQHKNVSLFWSCVDVISISEHRCKTFTWCSWHWYPCTMTEEEHRPDPGGLMFLPKEPLLEACGSCGRVASSKKKLKAAKLIEPWRPMFVRWSIY